MEVDIDVKRYGKRVSLRNIHLMFPKGETSMIIGTSRAGKSTLIKCMTQETSYKGMHNNYNKGEIAYIPQYPALDYRETVYDAVFWSARFAYPLESIEKVRKKAKIYIEQVGLSNVQKNKIRNISGGQAQRVSIAKELIRNKSILIADEIDTGLDCGVARSLVALLRKITYAENKTTIIVSHNLINIDLYDNVIVIAKDSSGTGRVAYAGCVNKMKSFFEVKTYVDVLIKVNTKEEGGLGQADQYIAKFETLRTRLLL